MSYHYSHSNEFATEQSTSRATPSRSQSWSHPGYATTSWEDAHAHQPGAHYQHENPYDSRHRDAYHFAPSSCSSSYDTGEVDQTQFHHANEYYQHVAAPSHYGGSLPSSSSVGAMSSSPSPRGDPYGWQGATDTTENQCQCQCGKSFRRPSDLAKHQKYHIKYFSCLFTGCDKAFATHKDLTRHTRTHNKGEGYQCNVQGCRKAASGHVYSRKDNFDRHMRTAHPNHPNP